jgi:hypothetical protein
LAHGTAGAVDGTTQPPDAVDVRTESALVHVQSALLRRIVERAD